jgi:hypothetical protein
MEVDLTKTAAFAVTDPKLMTVDFADLDKRQREVRAQRDEAWAKAHPPDGSTEWRNELQSLQWVKNVPSEKSARQMADTREAENLLDVKEHEGQIKSLRKVLASPHIQTHSGFDPNGEPLVTYSDGYMRGGQACGCDGCSILRNIERAEHNLGLAKKKFEGDTRHWGEVIKTAKRADKLRARLLELEQREREISVATRQSRGALPARPRMSGGLAADEIEIDLSHLGINIK